MQKRLKFRSFRCQKGSREEGSALITAIIFAFFIALASASYLQLASSEYRSAVRSSLYSSSLNLAESGVEIGIASLIDGQASGNVWKKQVSNYLDDGRFRGDIEIAILNASGQTPVIYADGIVKGHPAGDIRKQVRVEVSAGFRPFEKGFSSRNGITLSGSSVFLDSYNSDYGFYGDFLGFNAPEDFGVDGRNRNDNIYVASDRVDAVGETAIDQGNAKVYGYVTVGPDSTVSIGPNGAVISYSDGNHDSSRVLSDFYADFPTLTQPSGSFNTTFSDIGGSALVIGSLNPDAPTYYNVDSISLSGNSTLSVFGHAVFVMSGDIEVSGKGAIDILNSSSLQVYTEDDVKIAGNGVSNANGKPSNFYLYGTAPISQDNAGTESAGQTIKIAGNGELHAMIYAPAAAVSLQGGGNSGAVYGGLVAFTAEIAGNSSFHFDEAARKEEWGGGGFTITSWLEMTGATAASTPKDLTNL